MNTKMIFLFLLVSCLTIISCHKDDDEAVPAEYIKVHIKGTSDDGIALNESFILPKLIVSYDSSEVNYEDMHCDTTYYNIAGQTDESIFNSLIINFRRIRYDLSPVIIYGMTYYKVINNEKELVINEINWGGAIPPNNHITNLSYDETTHIVKADFEFLGGMDLTYKIWGNFVVKLSEIPKEQP
jgi:hypothetical protein